MVLASFLLTCLTLHWQVLGNALDGMELEDDSKSLPQVLGSKLYIAFFVTYCCQ